jgi:hypothetical protein
MTNDLDCNWSRTHGNTSSCLKNKSNAHSTSEEMVGSRNNCQRTKCIPKILTCGITYLVKRKENLMSVRACRWKNANVRKAYKQRQCLHLVLDTMFTTMFPNSSIAIKVYLSKVKTPCLSKINNSYSIRKIKLNAKFIYQPMHLCKLARFIELNDDGLQASLNTTFTQDC